MNEQNPAACRRERRALRELGASPLFACLPADELDCLAQQAELHGLKGSSALFRQNQLADALYILSTGQVKLVRTCGRGDEKLLQLIAPGQALAPMVAAVSPSRYPVSAIAVVPSHLWKIDLAHVRELLQQYPACSSALMAQLGQQLEQLIIDIEMLTLHDATSRLVAWLLESMQRPVGKRSVVELSLPKNVIASRLSIVPATFSRTLARLHREGLLEVHDSRIVLSDIARLRDYADPVAH